MHPLDPTLQSLPPLFAAHRHLTAVWRAVLEGRLGRAWGDDPVTAAAARLDVGCYAVFGGDPASAGAGELIASVAAPKELIYPSLEWRRRILAVHSGRLGDRPMASFSGAELDPDRLRRLAAGLAGGYRLAELTAATARQLDAELEPNALQTYPGPEALTRDGMAWGAFTREGGQLVSVASSYALSSREVEVAIATRPAHRGRGLAAAVAARFCLAAIERGVEPCWNASNPISQRLALRLGFRPAGTCEVLYLEAASRGG